MALREDEAGVEADVELTSVATTKNSLAQEKSRYAREAFRSPRTRLKYILQAIDTHLSTSNPPSQLPPEDEDALDEKAIFEKSDDVRVDLTQFYLYDDPVFEAIEAAETSPTNPDTRFGFHVSTPVTALTSIERGAAFKYYQRNGITTKFMEFCRISIDAGYEKQISELLQIILKEYDPSLADFFSNEDLKLIITFIDQRSKHVPKNIILHKDTELPEYTGVEHVSLVVYLQGNQIISVKRDVRFLPRK